MNQLAVLSPEEIVDRVKVMMKQEQSVYAYRLYLPPKCEKSDPRLNITWREKICQWSYNVVDHFDLSREVVAVSLSLFDRFMATRGNECTGNLALLASLTTLHIAMKLHDSKKIKLATLANLSRGQFGVTHIEAMEWSILAALKFRLHPPTQYTFVAYFLLFLPNETQSASRKELYEMSRYLTELSICDSYFVDVDNSVIAFAAILNVLDDMSFARIPAGIRERFLRNLSGRIGLYYSDQRVMGARHRLRTMLSATTVRSGGSLDSVSSRVKSPENEPNSSAGSMSSTGSKSAAPRPPGSVGERARANSYDSKGSGRFASPSSRRCLAAAVSPLSTGRGRLSYSPMVAGIQ